MRLAISISIILAGCSAVERTWEPTTIRACETQDEMSALQDWMLECIERANPKSDEEPEDWMPTCEAIGRRAICVTEVAAVQLMVGGNPRAVILDCRRAVTIESRQACTASRAARGTE